MQRDMPQLTEICSDHGNQCHGVVCPEEELYCSGGDCSPHLLEETHTAARHVATQT